jgi:hypothetical protein
MQTSHEGLGDNAQVSAKLFEDFKELGFVNYQEVTGPINDCKIVVCLDSLYRVTKKLRYRCD